LTLTLFIYKRKDFSSLLRVERTLSSSGCQLAIPFQSVVYDGSDWFILLIEYFVNSS